MIDRVGHAAHDRSQVAEAVDRGARLAPALQLCGPCVSLHLELVALLAWLPRAALPARPRSYVLTAEDAHRLRPGGWRAWWSAIGSARDSLTRPLAVGLTTLGLAGLLLTAAPTLLLGLGGAASSTPATPEVGVPAASLLSGDREPAVAGAEPPRDAGSIGRSVDGPPPTFLLSVGLILAGGTLFVVRRVATHARPVR